MNNKRSGVRGYVNDVLLKERLNFYSASFYIQYISQRALDVSQRRIAVELESDSAKVRLFGAPFLLRPKYHKWGHFVENFHDPSDPKFPHWATSVSQPPQQMDGSWWSNSVVSSTTQCSSTTLGFLMWGYVKDIVDRTTFPNEEEFRRRITTAIHSITTVDAWNVHAVNVQYME